MAKKHQDKKAEPKTVAPSQTTKPESKPKRQSNLELGRELYARKATEKEVVAAYSKVYAGSGKDAAWIAKRAAIYMRIAKRESEK